MGGHFKGMVWQIKNAELALDHVLVLGIVNVTPDSFSDGGRYYAPAEAFSRARNCVREGADVVDLGGESTRPGAAPLPWQAEWARLEPVFERMRIEGFSAPVSVDTYHPETAARAVEAGAAIVNCVRPEAVPAMARLSRATGCGLVVPFRGGEWPADCPRGRTLVDPEIGFGTTREEDLALLARIPEFSKTAPTCVGASRKRIVKKIVGERVGGKNLGGSVGMAVWCAAKGAAAVRVHDVAETVQALAVWSALEKGGTA